jgi:hypothetical protein
MHNLEIQINTTIIKKVKALNFQVDQLGSILFILFSLYENRLDLLDEFDDYNKQRRAIFLYEELAAKGLITRSEKPEKNEPLYHLTKEGMAFVETLKLEFKLLKEDVTSEVIAVTGIETLTETIIKQDEVEGWIDDWVDIFPKGVKSGGRLLRSDRVSCLRKMKIFLREYQYDKEVIMQATRNYIKSKEQDNYAYTRCAVYFIYRVDGNSRQDRISDLASWCDDVLNKRADNSENRQNNLEIMV